MAKFTPDGEHLFGYERGGKLSLYDLNKKDAVCP
jgi:hypothetical protein